jgi:hypothetical protein
MAYLREILNHTFLRTIYHTSSRQAKLEYQEVQRNFLNDHSNDDPNDPVVKFTALDIIRYIESDFIRSNDKALQSIHNSISKMVRHNNQSLLDWLQSFVPPMNKFLKVTHQQVLDADDAKAIWKSHFANQITLAEKTMIMLFQQQHLTANEIREIRLLQEGEFNEKTLQKLVTKLSSSFEPIVSIMAIGDNNRKIPKEKDIPKIQLKAKAKAKAERKEKENMEAKRAKGKIKVEEKVNRSQNIGRDTTKKKRQ